MLVRLTALALAGALGTLSRYALTHFAQPSGVRFPVGTFTVNIVGCLLFGIVWSLADTRELIGPEVRMIVLVGFMGAFTTFSTLIFDTQQLASASEWLMMAMNAGGQLALGLAMFGLGTWIGRIA